MLSTFRKISGCAFFQAGRTTSLSQRFSSGPERTIQVTTLEPAGASWSNCMIWVGSGAGASAAGAAVGASAAAAAVGASAGAAAGAAVGASAAGAAAGAAVGASAAGVVA